MVPLDTPLASGQRVEIVAAKSGGPSRDWLNPELGFLKSHRARGKVRQWFNARQLAETVAQGRATVEKEQRREGAMQANLEQLAHEARLRQARRAVRRGRARRGQPAPAAGGVARIDGLAFPFLNVTVQPGSKAQAQSLRTTAASSSSAWTG